MILMLASSNRENNKCSRKERENLYCCPVIFRWLQPDSYADPQKTSLILNKDDIRCGWPTTVVVQTKDQYGDVVHVPNMKVGLLCAKKNCILPFYLSLSEFFFFFSDRQVEVKAVPVSQKKSIQQDNMKKLQRLPGSPSNSASGMDLTFGGLPAPKLEATYEPMIIKEARYIAITMMKVHCCRFVYMWTDNK